MRKQALRLFFGVFLSKLIQQSTGLEVVTKTTSSTGISFKPGACASV